jgi:galactoside O-acetyltransferase
MKSLKKLMSDTARAPYPTNLSGRNVKNEHVDDRKNKAGKLFTDMCEGLPEKDFVGKQALLNKSNFC